MSAPIANGHVFGELDLGVVAGRPRPDPVRADGRDPARPGSRPTSGSSTSARSAAPSRLLCGGAGAPAGSLSGAIALVSRGRLPVRGEGRTRPGGGRDRHGHRREPPRRPDVRLFSALDGGMISDLDGARLRAAMAGSGGAATVRFSREMLEVPRAGPAFPTSFSAGGLTPFGKALKPDLTAPGAQILSSTLPEFAGDHFAVLDGTSFSAPHVAGAAALLLERHPSWTPQQVKSALMSTAGPAFADSAYAGGVRARPGRGPRVGSAADSAADLHRPAVALVRLPRARRARRAEPIPRPRLGRGRRRGHVECRGAASDRVERARPSRQRRSRSPPAAWPSSRSSLAPRRGAVQGDNFGFVVLRRGDVVRGSRTHSPCHALPLGGLRRSTLRRQPERATRASGKTGRASTAGRRRRSRSSGSSASTRPSTTTAGRRSTRSTSRARPSTRASWSSARRRDQRLDQVASQLERADPSLVPRLARRERRARLRRHPGERRTGSCPTSSSRSAPSGGVFLPPGRYYVSVDSGRDLFTGRSLAGPYTLRSWVNDVRPPWWSCYARVSSGRPTIVARITDDKSASTRSRCSSSSAALSSRRDAVRPGDGHRGVPVPARGKPLRPGRSSCGSSPPTSRRRRTSTPRARTRCRTHASSESAWRREPAGGVLDHAEPERVRRRPPATVRRRERQRADLVRRLLRRESPDRPRPPQRLRDLRADVADVEQASWHARAPAVASDVRGREAESTRVVRVCR